MGPDLVRLGTRDVIREILLERRLVWEIYFLLPPTFRNSRQQRFHGKILFRRLVAQFFLFKKNVFRPAPISRKITFVRPIFFLPRFFPLLIYIFGAGGSLFLLFSFLRFFIRFSDIISKLNKGGKTDERFQSRIFFLPGEIFPFSGKIIFSRSNFSQTRFWFLTTSGSDNNQRPKNKRPLSVSPIQYL